MTALKDTYLANACMGCAMGYGGWPTGAVRLTANPKAGFKSSPDQEDNSEICESFTRTV